MKKGDTVFFSPLSSPEQLQPVTVVSVGKKWIAVTMQDGTRGEFARPEQDQYYNHPRGRIYPTNQAHADSQQHTQLLVELSRCIGKATLQQCREMAAIMGIESETTTTLTSIFDGHDERV